MARGLVRTTQDGCAPSSLGPNGFGGWRGCFVWGGLATLRRLPNIRPKFIWRNFGQRRDGFDARHRNTTPGVNRRSLYAQMLRQQRRAAGSLNHLRHRGRFDGFVHARTLAVPIFVVNRCYLSSRASHQSMANAEGPGDRIAQALKAAGMRPVDLARKLKVSQPTVHAWVNQMHGIKWANVRRVASALKVSPGWIMFGANEEAERVAQTAVELAFLRLFRELDDPTQASVLRLLTAMPRTTIPTLTPPEPNERAPPPRPRLGGSVAISDGCEGGANVVQLPRVPA